MKRLVGPDSVIERLDKIHQYIPSCLHYDDVVLLLVVAVHIFFPLCSNRMGLEVDTRNRIRVEVDTRNRMVVEADIRRRLAVTLLLRGDHVNERMMRLHEMNDMDPADKIEHDDDGLIFEVHYFPLPYDLLAACVPSQTLRRYFQQYTEGQGSCYHFSLLASLLVLLLLQVAEAGFLDYCVF
jgi:hypothetical protein